MIKQSITHQPSIIYQSTNHQANFANLAPGCTATQPLYQGLSDAQPQASGCTKATVPYPPPWRQQNSTPMPPPPSKLVPKSPNYPPPYATQQQLQQLNRKLQGEVHIHFHSPAASSGPYIYIPIHYHIYDQFTRTI